MGIVYATETSFRVTGGFMSEEPSEDYSENEEELVRACLQGDQASWQRLYREYRKQAWSVLYRLLGPLPEIEDLVQTVFFKVFRSLGKFEGRSKLATWLYSICVHVAMDHRRKKSRQGARNSSEMLPFLPSPDPDPCREAELTEKRNLLGQALSRMKKSKRTVLVLYDLMDVPVEEIAAMLGTPVPTVRSRLFYARKELARLLTRSKESRI
jgi:RNA polymerase sigma-70 factor, ECF subfamily